VRGNGETGHVTTHLMMMMMLLELISITEPAPAPYNQSHA